jgi:plastocyanin
MSRQPRHAARRLAGGLVIATVLAAWACNNPSGQGNGCASTGADVVISAQDNLSFDKPSLTITRGQKVCWQNPGSQNHTVTATSSLPFDTLWTSTTFDNRLAPGFVVIHTFSTAGTYYYHCSIHAGMTGTITVP